MHACAHVQVRQFFCNWVWKNFRKCECGCVHAPFLGADVLRMSAHSHFLLKTYFSVINNQKEKKIEIIFEKMCNCGCACERKKWRAGACTAHYDFCALNKVRSMYTFLLTYTRRYPSKLKRTVVKISTKTW